MPLVPPTNFQYPELTSETSHRWGKSMRNSVGLTQTREKPIPLILVLVILLFHSGNIVAMKLVCRVTRRDDVH